MSKKYLGDSFDIHGGGEDLVFPHHENEVAQSEGASGKAFVKYWIHHAFVTIKEEKMSKSLNNFLTIRDVLKRHDPEALRLMVFTTHYRNPLDFSDSSLLESQAGMNRLYSCLAECAQLADGHPSVPPVATKEEQSKLRSLENRFQEAMDNDFNTAQALGSIFDAVKSINRIKQALSKKPASQDIDLLKESAQSIKTLAGILGLLRRNPDDYFKDLQTKHLEAVHMTQSELKQLIDERNNARANKDWGKADLVRDTLLKKNIELKDGPEGTTWKIST
jgi:cysteinyl-tRNA synthetase